MGVMTGNRCAGLGKENAHARPPLDALGAALKEKVRPPPLPAPVRHPQKKTIHPTRTSQSPRNLVVFNLSLSLSPSVLFTFFLPHPSFSSPPHHHYPLS